MVKNMIQKMDVDYGKLLQEMVAIISNARLMLAQKIATISSNVHWQIGKILFENKIDSKNGSNVIKRLSVDLKKTTNR